MGSFCKNTTPREETITEVRARHIAIGRLLQYVGLKALGELEGKSGKKKKIK